MGKNQEFRFSVAPMMEWTDRHCRYFHRLMSKRARLYTEMVTSAAILHGRPDRLLKFDTAEHPLALQLGGNRPLDLAKAARIGADYGYDEINLNVGCPSDRVQNGAFGAALMREPRLVGECVAAMKAVVKIPVTVKCRLGIDEQDPSQSLWDVTRACVMADADGLIVHARKAWLQGLSPKENRDVPPLDYALVHHLKLCFPQMPIAINGGLTALPQMMAELEHVDGVMVGRAAYQEPALLLEVDSFFFNEAAPHPDAFSVIEAFVPYIETRLAEGFALHSMTRHVLGIFNGWPGARSFRRHLATEGINKHADASVLRQACGFVKRSSKHDEAYPAA